MPYKYRMQGKFFYTYRCTTYKYCKTMNFRVPAKKTATLRSEQSTVWGFCMGIKGESEILKLPAALDCQAAYFYILHVCFRI